MKRTLLLIVTLFFSYGMNAQDHLSPELLWDLKRVGGPSISPDGNWALFGVSTYDVHQNKGDRNLYVVSLDPRTAPEDKIVAISELEGSERNERWTKDGEVMFISSIGGSPQVWKANLRGQDPIQISNFKDGIGGFEISDDGSMMIVAQDVKLDQSINDKYADLPMAEARVTDDLMYRHWSQWHDYAYSHVFLSRKNQDDQFTEGKDLMLNEPYDSPMNPFGGMEEICFAQNDQSIVYTCKKLKGKEYTLSTNSDLYSVDLKTNKTTNLSEGMVGYDKHPSSSPDGLQVAWLSMEANGFESDKNDIILLTKATGEKRNLTKEFDLTVDDYVWGPRGRKIYFKAMKDACAQIFELDLRKGNYRQITSGDYNHGGFDISPDGRYLIAGRQNMIRPYELYKIDIRKGKPEKLTGFNDDLYAALDLPPVEKRFVKTTDGKDMLTWIIYPPNFNPEKPHPTLLYCQGGPQSAVSQFFSYRWNFHLMAANNYVIVAPNRRGLPGFGVEWNDQISKDWGGQCMKDYLSAIDEISKEPFVDVDRLGAVGASFGGYSVYWLAGNHEKRFKAFISHCGLFNLESWYGATEEMFFANWDVGGPYWDSSLDKDYEAFSPHKFVKNWDTPIMVIHGEKDFRVPIGEGLQAFQAAQLNDVPSRFLYFPKEGHWVLSPQNGLVWHREFFEWLDKWLKP